MAYDSFCCCAVCSIFLVLCSAADYIQICRLSSWEFPKIQTMNHSPLIDLSNKSTMAFVLRHCRADKDPNNPVDHNENHRQQRQNLVAKFPKPELVNKMNYGGLTRENTVVYLESTFTFTFALVWRPTEIIE